MNKKDQNLNSSIEPNSYSDSKCAFRISGDRSRIHISSKKATMKDSILEIVNLEEKAYPL